MAHHLLCLTIDTDPDGLNTHNPDRHTLVWDGLYFGMEQFHRALPEVPLTWYVRADGQLEQAYGSARYLLDERAAFWKQAIGRGDELGWHPHLYTLEAVPQIITDAAQAVAELSRLWSIIREVDVALPTFRMGEGWHTAATLNLVEKLGFTVDATAIPGRDDRAAGHPRNWSGAPNYPYYPAQDDIRRVGQTRPLLEVPMNSWLVPAPYDTSPRLRYMNPCIHSALWEQALAWWEAHLPAHDLHLWNMILHPAEAMPHDQPDLLYAYSLDTLAGNLRRLVARIQLRGDTADFTTVGAAARRWIEFIR